MTPNSTEERVVLKPCPFCGGAVDIIPPVAADSSSYIGHRGNGGCVVEFSAFLLDDDAELATAWNTRTDNDVSGLVEALEEAKHRRSLTVSCNECNADDVRFWDGVIRFLGEFK